MKTAMNFLIEWTENVNWKRYLLNAVLQKKETDIEMITKEVIDIIINKKEVSLIVSPSQTTEQEKLFIKEIKAPININALCSDVSCGLGTNLNVFYGENGSGKSSYVKAFRRLADNYYTSEKNLNIMSNVYLDFETTSDQTITVSYCIDGKENNNQCVDINKRHTDLSKINVFDTGSINPLLNTDLTFSVLPQGLNYFSRLTELIDNVRTEVKEIISKNQLEQNTIFMDSSFLIVNEDIATITKNVANTTKLDEYLKVNYLISEDVDNRIESINNNTRDLKSANPVGLIKILSTQKAKLEAIIKSFNILAGKVNEENINSVNELIKQYDELLSNEKKYNEEFSNKVHHIECVNKEWISFIYAAREYYSSIGIGLPEESSECIFCGQALNKQQIDLIESCFQHVSSEIMQKRKDIDQRIQAYSIPDVAITLLSEDEKLFNEDKKLFIERLKITIDIVDKNQKIFRESIENKRRVPGECLINFKDIIDDINKEIKFIDGRLDDLGKTNLEITEIIKSYTSQKDELVKKKKINESKELFKKWYKYKNQIDILTEIKNKLSTASLTTKSKEAFKEIVATDYIDTFNGYCKKLGVANVSVLLSSQKGQSKRSKYVVKENIKVTEIMSEGEQKAIALAEFATDLKIRKNFCTVLFDDPVTSFDYKRAQKIADMVYEISKERQVVVFTHNIMFYYYLYNCCSKDNYKENKFFKIDEFDRDNKGLISVSAEGRLENLNEVTKKIKNYAQRVNSINCVGDDLEQTLKATYSEIRTWCELIVEEGFLKKVIRRYEPNIMFKPVSKITPEFIGYIPAVSDLFDKSCRYMIGHSQPTETQNIKASREEFSTDLSFITDLYEKYKG